MKIFSSLASVICCAIAFSVSCKPKEQKNLEDPPAASSSPLGADTTLTILPIVKPLNSHIDPGSVVDFSKTLIGTPYFYASTDPLKGFDCSGFITYVFNHFGMQVPRSSVDFTDYGKDISMQEAKPGDLILFTGTDSTVRIVGHMGIVESTRNDSLYFIHSTSGKGKGVMITPFGNYYQGRFVKVIRIFPDSFFE
ncbi:MAG: C40 family peptidase [Chitinophagaceae bacterium]